MTRTRAISVPATSPAVAFNTLAEDAVLTADDAPILGQRHTRQRDTIYEVLKSASGPLPVPEIHQRAAQLVPKIGIATIYRALKLMLGAEQIQSVVLPSGETRYKIAGSGHHDHFQCRSCHQVYDLETCPVHLEGVCETARDHNQPHDHAHDHSGVLPNGFVVEDHTLTLYGLCADCTVPVRS